MSNLNNTNPYENTNLIIQKITNLENELHDIKNNTSNSNSSNNKNVDKPRSFNRKLILATLKGLLFFYLIIAGNYIGELFQCRVIKLLNENIYTKHLIAIISLYFFVVLADDTIYPVLSHTKIFAITFLLYLYFLITSKVDPFIWILQLFVLFIIVFVQYYKNSEGERIKSETDRLKLEKIINLFQNLLIGFLVLSTLYGFLVYYGNKKLEYKENFSIKEFFFKLECRGNAKGRDMKLKPFRNFSDRIKVLKAAFS